MRTLLVRSAEDEETLAAALAQAKIVDGQVAVQVAALEEKRVDERPYHYTGPRPRWTDVDPHTGEPYAFSDSEEREVVRPAVRQPRGRFQRQIVGSDSDSP